MLSDAQLQSLFHFCFALTAHEKSAYTLMMHFASKHQLDPNAKSNLTEIYHRIREQFHQHYEDSSLDATKDSKVCNFDPDAIKIPQGQWQNLWSNLPTDDRAHLFLCHAMPGAIKNITVSGQKMLMAAKAEEGSNSTDVKSLRSLIQAHFAPVTLEEKKLLRIKKALTPKQKEPAAPTTSLAAGQTEVSIEASQPQSQKLKLAEPNQNSEQAEVNQQPSASRTVAAAHQAAAPSASQAIFPKQFTPSTVSPNAVRPGNAKPKPGPKAVPTVKQIAKTESPSSQLGLVPIKPANDSTIPSAEVSASPKTGQNPSKVETLVAKQKIQEQNPGQVKEVSPAPMQRKAQESKSTNPKPEAKKIDSIKPETLNVQAETNKSTQESSAKSDANISKPKPKIQISPKQGKLQVVSKAEKLQKSVKEPQAPNVESKNLSTKEELQKKPPSNPPQTIGGSRVCGDNEETAIRPVNPQLQMASNDDRSSNEVELATRSALDNISSDGALESAPIETKFDRATIYSVFDQEFETKLAEIKDQEAENEKKAEKVHKPFNRGKFAASEYVYSLASVAVIIATSFYPIPFL